MNGMRTHEEIVGVWAEPPDLEELHQVIKLAVDIATYLHRTSAKARKG